MSHPLADPTPPSLPCDMDRLAQAFADLASQAGCVILHVYNSDFAVKRKADASPVCAADEAAEVIILKGLSQILPGIPIIAEEAAAGGNIPTISDTPFLLVDPLDGTVEFVERNGEFTVNIALIVQGRPVCGVVYAPLDGTLYLGGATARRGILSAGQTFDPAQAKPIQVRAPGDTFTVVMSRSHACDTTKAWAKAHGASEIMSRGSALKFGLIAEGLADAYPRFTPTMEWDTAAGHAVVQAAGGSVLCPDGQPFIYGRAEHGFRNGPFIARGLVAKV